MTANSLSPIQIIAKAASLDRPTKEDKELPDLEMDLEEHKLQYEVNTLRQELQEAKDNHLLRIGYAGRIFYLICAWLGCVVICLLLTGFKKNFFLYSGTGFLLSDKVLITFITTTTLNVVGIFIIVAKWMYPNGDKKDPPKKPPKPKE